MRFNAYLLLLPAAVLLLAESQPGMPGPLVEVHTTNGAVDIAGWDGDHVQVSGSSEEPIPGADGRIVVRDFNRSLSLQVPRRASIEVATSNGAIHVSGVSGALHLTTSNGAIEVKDSAGAEIHAHSSNGQIELVVPHDLKANLSARTSNGQIRSDVSVVTGRVEATCLEATCLEGTIGGGGATIDLLTSNGMIYIRSGSGQERVSSTFKPGKFK